MIGIFGGTFDPVHFGHLRAIIEVRDIFKLTEVRLIPNKSPPHRLAPAAAPNKRLEMLKLAIDGLPDLIIDSRELDREGPSFMVDTLLSLRDDFPERPLLLFIGVDAFNGLSGWRHWRQLFDYAHIVVLTRPGYIIQLRDAFLRSRQAAEKTELAEEKAGKLFFQAITQLEISSTAIRKMIAEKHDPRFLLPDAVLDYIDSRHLYQNA